MSHGDKVAEFPPGFAVMASTPSCPIAGMADETRGFYAVQFHPEVTHTVQGQAMLGRFVHDICGCKSDWNMPDYVSEAVERIRAQVGADEVILGLSRSEEHTSELQSLMRISYAVFCLKKKNTT